MTTFLRFPDEASAIAAMPGWHDAELGWRAPTATAAVDVIGAISIGGEWDIDGNELVPPAILPGWHMNILGELPETALPFQVFPEPAYRLFAA